MKRATLGRCRWLVLPLFGWPALAHASATFTIQNLDGPNEGFNDATPAAPVGGNPGTTVGQQRLNAFTEATSIWGKLLDSDVPIVIAAQFSSLTCNANTITLGQARASGFEANQPGLPPDILVPEPLADRMAGYDLNPGMEDIDAAFNGNLSGCSNGLQDWYYGYDGKPPGDDIDLISVLLHEFGHGLGFLSGVDSTTGQLLGGLVDTFTAHLYDDEAAMLWSDMNDSERAASAENVRHLVWQGDNVTAMAAQVLAKGAPRLTPAPVVSGLLGALAEANFGPFLSAGTVRGPVVVGTPTDGCGYPPSYAGQVVMYLGGDCPASQKSSLAESAGALAVLLLDPAGLEPPSTIEDPPDQVSMFPVRIPVIGVTQGDGYLLSQTTENVTLDADETRLVGTDAQGRMYMYASDPILPSSTVSHWDPLARPDLMQEPVASYTVSHDLRMEAALMRDIGWAPFCGNGQIDQQEQCDDGVYNSDTTPGACRTDCLLPHCGDSVVDPGEQCDNGAANSDTAPGACRTTCVSPSCGDGVVDPGEQCDDGIANNSNTTPGACRTTCVSPSCGDGVIDPGEQCDDGSANAAGAACGLDCRLPGASTGNGGSSGASGGGGSGASGGSSGGDNTGGDDGGDESGGGGCKCAVGDGDRPGAATLTLLCGLGALLNRRRSRQRASA